MKYNFQWFEKEDHRRALRASVGRDGKLRLGKILRAALPAYVQIGYDTRTRTLAIADGHGFGIDLPQCGMLSAQALSVQLVASGLRLPVSFLLTKDEQTGYYLGRVFLRRYRVKGTRQRQYDPQQALTLYGHLVDNAVAQQAKSTPLDERRAFAQEAFCRALQDYCPGCGDLETYLAERIRQSLLRENRQFTASYRQRSLDAPLTDDSDDKFCLYDTLAVSSAGGLDSLEEKIMAQQFIDSLTPPERRLARMLQEGYKLGQIAGALAVDEEQVVLLARQIAQKRRKFYAA